MITRKQASIKVEKVQSKYHVSPGGPTKTFLWLSNI